jgi:hypothetical protein
VVRWKPKDQAMRILLCAALAFLLLARRVAGFSQSGLKVLRAKRVLRPLAKGVCA